MKKNGIRKLVVLALLIGLNIVFSRILSLSAWNFKISLTFTTLLLAGYLYGPFYAAVVGGVGDLIGSLLFPIGAYNPLFTLTAVLSGLVFGYFHYDNCELRNTVTACLINQLVISLLLNSWFIAMTYRTSFAALLATRALQSLVMLMIELLIIRLLEPVLPRLRYILKK
ncbi:MAG: folate family ECF transporter S component [Erysipelotrichaceae bacterium]|nr:folate family ECF transporter S component [Erysipelotrichaceae bacterium]